MNIHKAVVVITGASSGIGLATARLFARQGARVAIMARSASKLAEIVQELPESLALPGDVRDRAAMDRMISLAHRHYGRIDVLVNNAGQGMFGPVECANSDDLRAIFELNVIGALNTMQAVIPVMREQQRGVIVNVSAGLAKYAIPGFGPYAATKAALGLLSATARLELAKAQISVGVVLLGYTATNFMDHAPGGRPAALDQQNLPDRDSPEQGAMKILEAVQTEMAEVYADSVAARRSQ